MERYTEELALEILGIKIGKDEDRFVYAQELPNKYKGKIKSKTLASTTAKPEFVIEQNKYKNKLIVVECKAKINQHNDAIKDVYHYIKNMSEITPKSQILGLAISGQEKENLEYTLIEVEGDNYKKLNAEKIFNLNEINNKFFEEKTRVMEIEELEELMESINKQFHKIGFSIKDRATSISALLAALQVEDFRKTYIFQHDISTLKDSILNSMKVFFNSQGLAFEKINQIAESARYTFNKYDNLDPSLLINILEDLHESPILISRLQKTKEGVDLLGRFFNSFLRYGGSDSKGLGQVLTPDHIADLFTELVNDGYGLKVHNQIVDITCGTGAFLVQSLTKLLNLAKNTQEREKIRESGVWGNERDSELVSLTILNNIMHGDGKSNIRNGDALDGKLKIWFDERGAEISHALINPPYWVKDTIPPELVFAYEAAKITKPGGEVLMIAPVSVLLGNKHKEERIKMMKHHTLKATFIMPKELFKGNASVETAISIWETHKPHSEKDKVYFADFSDDGFVSIKNKGRIDINNTWDEIKNNFIKMYKNKKVIDGKSAYVKVGPEDEWTLYPYMKIDINKIDKKLFEEAIKEFVSFKVLGGK